MLTRSRARATNQHIFVDDQWNDKYIQTKDEQIEMLHAQMVLPGWDDEENMSSDTDSQDSSEDRWISEDEEDDDDDESIVSDSFWEKNDAGIATWISGGNLWENILWTCMGLMIAPMLLYIVYRQWKIHRHWPLRSRSMLGMLWKIATNVMVFVLVWMATYWAGCGGGMTVLYGRDRFSLQSPSECIIWFVDGWGECMTHSDMLTTTDEGNRLIAQTVLLLIATILALHFHRFWLKTCVFCTAIALVVYHLISEWNAKQRTAVGIYSLDPTTVFVNETTLVSIDGQNLAQGGTIAWIPYWNGLQKQRASQCEKYDPQPLNDGAVSVTFNHVNEFIPCYGINGRDDGFHCFEHLRIRVKDHKSVPGWSLREATEEL